MPLETIDYRTLAYVCFTFIDNFQIKDALSHPPLQEASTTVLSARLYRGIYTSAQQLRA